MKKLKEKYIAFMRGRYGGDQLNTALLICALIISFISGMSQSYSLMVLSDVLLIICVYRMFSKNINRRVMENRVYREKITIVKRHFKK